MTVPLVRNFPMAISSIAVSSNFSVPVVNVPWAAVVTAVTFVPAQAVSAIAATSGAPRTYTLYNRLGSASLGTGTVVIARGAVTSLSASQTAFGSTSGGLFDNVASTLPLNATTTSLTVAAGDVLEWESSQSATGTADPGGLVIVTLSRI